MPTTQQQKANNSKIGKGLEYTFFQRYSNGQPAHKKMLNITNH